MARRRDAEGAFTVTGPLEEDHPVPTVGAGVSCALTFANHRRRDEGEFTYYVRDLAGTAHGGATKHENGAISTLVVA